jgi:multidrug resistance protein, MATE family
MLSWQSKRIAGRWPHLGPLLQLAWPIAVSMLSYSLMTAIDTLFVGRKGAEPIAAVGLGGLVSFTLLTFAMGLLRGGKVLVAHAHGAGHTSKIDALARANVALSIVLSVASLAATLAVAPLLRHAFAEPRAGQLVVSYVVVRAIAIPFFLMATSIRESSQALGDSRRPMLAALAANLANIPLNALLVVVLDLGVVGSAIANVLAQVIDLCWLCTQRKGWINVARADGSTVGRIVRLGWPLGVEMFLDVSSFSALAFIIAQFGAAELAAHQIALQVSHLTLLPILALAEAASVLAGQAAGGGRLDDIRPIVRASLAAGLTFAATIGIVLVCCPLAVATFFTNDTAVRRLAALLVQMVAGFQLGFVLYAVGRAVLRGLGDLRYTACVTVGVAWICTPSLGLVLGRYFGYGVVGGWCGISVEVSIASMLYFWRLERRGWTTPHCAHSVGDESALSEISGPESALLDSAPANGS